MQFCYEQRHFCLGRQNRGRNIHVPLVETEVEGLWFGKICCSLNGIGDLNEREVIASAFARRLDLPVPEVVIVNLPAEVTNFSDLQIALLEFASKDRDNLVKIGWDENGRQTNWAEKLLELRSGHIPWKQMAAVRWVKGATPLKDWPGEVKSLQNLGTILQSIVFNLWFGNHEDNIEVNVIVDDTDTGWCVDFGYSGPGRSDDIRTNINYKRFDDFGTTRQRQYYNKLLPSKLIDTLDSRKTVAVHSSNPWSSKLYLRTGSM